MKFCLNIIYNNNENNIFKCLESLNNKKSQVFIELYSNNLFKEFYAK